VTCRFDELYDEAVPLLLAGAHQRDVPPTEGGRWPVSVFLALSGAVAERLHGLTAEAARIAGTCPRQLCVAGGAAGALRVEKRGSVAGAKPVMFAEAAFGERSATLRETRSQTV